MEPPEIPIPEVPGFVDAEIVRHPTTGLDCLLATTEEGERLAFAFEVESDTPGPELVDHRVWLAAAEGGPPEHGPLRFEAVEELRADEWLQSLVTHPVAAEWLGRVKEAHPDAYHKWFAQTDYDEGGEEGAG